MLGNHTQTAQLPAADDVLIPDEMGTVRGWRTWQTKRDDATGQLQLVSPNGTVWMPGERASAKCGQFGTTGHEGMCERDGCGCGFNTFTRRRKLRSQYTQMDVWGELHLWGMVRSYEMGSRGQYAYPARLFVDPLKHPSATHARDVAQELACIYGVPVRVRARPGLHLMWGVASTSRLLASKLWQSRAGAPARQLCDWMYRPNNDDASGHAIVGRRALILTWLPTLILMVMNAPVVMLARNTHWLVNLPLPRTALALTTSIVVASSICFALKAMQRFKRVQQTRYGNVSEVPQILATAFGGIAVLAAFITTGVALDGPTNWDTSQRNVDWMQYVERAEHGDQSVRVKLSSATRADFEHDYTFHEGASCTAASDDLDALVVVCRDGDDVVWHDSNRLVHLGK